jgi:pseudouridine synthase
MEERLQKFLARAGVASRRKSEALVLEGRVAVNGKVVRRLGTKVDPERDEVRVDTVVVRGGALPSGPPAPERGEARRAPLDPRSIYLLMNKPNGFLCTTADDRGRRTVMDLLPRLPGRVWPVGRLDEDSEGLLLLTNDGTLTNLLTHPRYEVPKVYDLRIRGEVTPDEVARVERGIWLSEGRTGPARMRIRRGGRDISHVQLTLREGRNREVRRIFARLRHPVLSLRRVSLGPLALEGLKPGQTRRLAQHEVRALYAHAAAAAKGGAGAPPAAKARPAGSRKGGHSWSRRPSKDGPPPKGTGRAKGGWRPKDGPPSKGGGRAKGGWRPKVGPGPKGGKPWRGGAGPKGGRSPKGRGRPEGGAPRRPWTGARR